VLLDASVLWVSTLFMLFCIASHSSCYNMTLGFQTKRWNHGTNGILVPTRRRYSLYSSPKKRTRWYSSAENKNM
jgi:hypothetical protein